jgi:2-dehydro-3-deoxy-D-arabinonate dehydratase
MNLCRFSNRNSPMRVGLVEGDSVLDLSAEGATSVTALLEAPNVPDAVNRILRRNPRRLALADVQLLPPVDRQEVWAVGVTYLRSKAARMEESDFSARAYAAVYEAPRPELFFKSLPEKVSGPGQQVGIRADAKWNVPEPELALVMNSRAELVGVTIGNDMSSRDIEGENLLYLPQAKVYDKACALGPWITTGVTEAAVRDWTIAVTIERGGKAVFEGQIGINQIKRSFQELIGYLYRSQTFPHGTVMLTGTGVVPGNDFTLAAEDRVRIRISGIGELVNDVVVV